MTAPDPSAGTCPMPLGETERVLLGHGSGGQLSAELIGDLLVPALGRAAPPLEDAAVFAIGDAELAISTDAYVVSPIFFAGGDIGSLAVHGTINDLAMRAAMPVALTVAYVIEGGFALSDLRRIAASVGAAARPYPRRDRVGAERDSPRLSGRRRGAGTSPSRARRGAGGLRVARPRPGAGRQRGLPHRVCRARPGRRGAGGHAITARGPRRGAHRHRDRRGSGPGRGAHRRRFPAGAGHARRRTATTDLLTRDAEAVARSPPSSRFCRLLVEDLDDIGGGTPWHRRQGISRVDVTEADDDVRFAEVGNQVTEQVVRPGHGFTGETESLDQLLPPVTRARRDLRL